MISNDSLVVRETRMCVFDKIRCYVRGGREKRSRIAKYIRKESYAHAN